MKWILVRIATLLILLFCQIVIASPGPLFIVTSSGTPANVNISLCLDGKGPISCQKYNVSALQLTILTTIPNHTYPAAGIKINTPGYNITDLTACTPISNGYCLFSVSDKIPKNIVLNKIAGYTIGGSITGLSGNGLILQNNGTNDLTVATGATSFQFTKSVPTGGSYHVTIKQQPMALRCFVSNGSGTNVINNVITVGISCRGSTAYVANFDSSSNSVTPINLKTNKPGTEIPVLDNPVGVAFTPDGQTAFITDNGTDKVTRITNGIPVATINVGLRPYGIVLSPDGSMAYSANYDDGTVSQISVATNQVVNTITGLTQGLIGIAITPDGNKLYVTNNTDNTVTVITLADNTLVTIPLLVPAAQYFTPWQLAITPDGKMAYVVTSKLNTQDGYVIPITLANNKLGTPIPVGKSPLWIAITPDGKKAYVTNSVSNNLSAITLANHSVKKIPLGGNPPYTKPYGIAITADGKTAYVSIAGTNDNDNRVIPITLATNTIGDPITVGTDPTGIGIS